MKVKNSTKSYSYLASLAIDYPLVFHILMWIAVLFILTTLTSLSGSWPYGFYLVGNLIALPAMLLYSYFLVLHGNHILFEKKKPGMYILMLFLATLFCLFLLSVLNHFLFFGLIYPRIFEPTPWLNWRSLPQNLILLLFPYFILSIKTFFENWFRSEQEKLIIENKQLLSEIQLMKIKLHPHFLFNTLNNLYAMSTKDNVRTSEYIMKLSDLFRIMLYECNKDFYPVEEELLLIKNYVELEKIRYDERLKLEFDLPNEVDSSLMIPPLLFFTFVENAFKHGCSNDVGNPYIKINIQLNGEYINFNATNSIPKVKAPKSDFGGIGLENTRKRLELIFEGDYNFKNEARSSCYCIDLKIPKLYMS